MDKAFAMVVGMTIAYVASFLGMILAWYSYNKRRGSSEVSE